MRAGLVALLVVALAAPARADESKQDDRAVGVIVQGGGSLRSKVAGHLAKRLRREGYTAVEEPLGAEALNTLANCFIIEDLACARGVVEARARTPRLVFTRIDDTTGEVTIDVTWFSHGRAPIAAKTACSDCTVTWKDHTGELLTTLMAQAEMPVFTEPDEPEQPPKHRSVWSKLLPRVLVGVGAATLITGGILLYYGLRDGPDHKYVYPSLTPVGITLIAVGGGAVIGGIITW